MESKAAVLGEDCYVHAFTALVVRHRDRDDAFARAVAAPAEHDDDDGDADKAVLALREVSVGRCPHSKLRAIVFALEALAEAKDDAGDDVAADVLLPRAARCVAVARVPHLHAELAFVERFARDETFLGVEGYALTTLRCALSIVLDEARDAARDVVDSLVDAAVAARDPPF